MRDIIMEREVATVFDAIDESIYQAQSIENEIIRDALLSTLEAKLKSDNKFIFVEGQEGIGKTTLLNQFVQRNKAKTVAIFIDPSTASGSYLESGVLKDMFLQVSRLNNELVAPSDYEESRLISALQNLQYSLKRKNDVAYFVIDGLDELPKDYGSISAKIVSLLPQSSREIKFILSTDKGETKELIGAKFKDSLEVTLLSEAEAGKMLPSLSEDEVKSAIEVFSRVPATIFQIRRLLDSGVSISDLLQDGETNSVIDLYKIEWNRNLEIINEIREELCLITFCKSPLTIESLSEINGCNKNTLRSNIEKLNILNVSDGAVSYASVGMKKFSENVFSDQELSSFRKIIKHLRTKENNIRSMAEANSYLIRCGENYEIIDQMSNTNLSKIFEESGSIGELSKQVGYGGTASTALDSPGNILRFSHLKSFIGDLGVSKILKSEIFSYLRSGDIKNAIDLASSSRSKEEKIELLSMVASSEKKKGREVGQFLVDQINSLFNDLEPEHIDVETVVNIAIEMYPVFPDQAMSLVNSVDSLGAGGDNKSDYAFLRFSLALISTKENSFEALEESIDTLSEKKKGLFSTLNLFKRGTPAVKIASEIEKMGNISNEILVIRNWIKAFPDAKDNFTLVEMAISKATSSVTYSANSGFYLDMAATIHYMSDEESAQIYSRILVQIDNLKKGGPTLDYVKLQIELIKHENRFNINSVRDRNLYDYIVFEVPDKSISLCALSTYHKFMSEEGVKTPFLADIKVVKDKIFNELINETAMHFEILRPALLAECEVDFNNSMKWSDLLNTQDRVDQAKCYIIENSCKYNVDFDLVTACKEIKKINKLSLRRRSLMAVSKQSLNRSSISNEEFRRLRKLKNSVLEGASACPIISILIEIAEKFKSCSAHELENLKKDLMKFWENIDLGWNRINMGFDIHNRLYDYDTEFATRIKNKSIEFREESSGVDENVSKSICDTIDLAIRAFLILVENGADSTKDKALLLDFIACLPANVHKAKELSRLSSAYQINGRPQDSSDIIESHILPLIEEAKINYGAYKICLAWSLPVIFKHNIHIFKNYLKDFDDDSEFIDLVSKNTIRYIFTSVLVGDPYNTNNNDFSIQYCDIEDIISLLGEMSSEPEMYCNLDVLTDVLSRKVKSNKLSNDQKAVIRDKLEKLVEEKFTNRTYIDHDGYYICAKASIMKAFLEKNQASWEEVIKQADRIGNKSDTSLVLSTIASYLPAKLRSQSIELYSRSETLIDDLPSDLDKITRYESLVECLKRNDKIRAKKVLKKAIAITSSDEIEEFDEKRTKLIDLAYGIDKEFPSTLSAVQDNDPARREVISAAVKENLRERNRSKNFEEDDQNDLTGETVEHLPEILWNLFSKYNAGRYAPGKNLNINAILGAISGLSTHEIYPVITFVISILKSRVKTKAQANDIVRPFFDSLMTNYALLLDICQIDARNIRRSGNHTENLLVGKSQINDASEFVAAVIRDHDVEKLTIIDSYFSLEDLNFIGEAISGDPNITLTILTSLKRKIYIENEHGEGIDDLIYDYWIDHINAQSLPSIKIIFTGIKSLDWCMPLHDRWWLFKDTGLRFGGSVNGLGKRRIQEISKIDTDARINIDHEVSGFISAKQKSYEGERVKYISFDV